MIMNIITKLNIRQKIMLTLTLVAAAFLTWQIYNFVRGNTSPDKSISAPAATLSPAVSAQPAVQKLPTQNLSNANLTYNQKQYLNLVHEYQITKMKRQILDEAAGLANAQKRIADVGKNNSLVGMDNFENEAYAGGGAYQLSYVDRQAGKWTATINQNGQYREVQIGSRLPNGSRVIAINNRGVVLRSSKGQSILLSFQGSVNVDSVAYKANSSAAKKVEPKASLPVAAPVSNSPVKPNNAKIAKMLGITKSPATSSIPTAGAAPTAPAVVSNTTDTQQNEIKPVDSTPAVANDALQSPSQVQPETNSQQNTQAIVKPVSVKELREHSADVDSGQITGQQAETLQAMLSNPVSQTN